MSAVFPFPGGKSRHASWILDYVPEHTCFVEVFGGAAGLLANKNPGSSDVEVYNDRDRDLVQFFEVLREDCDALVAWLEQVPYSREIHSEWARKYYQGYRPKDAVKRAGRFFYLRYTQWGAGYDSPSGFATSKVSCSATSYANKLDRLEDFAHRFDAVTIENLDWQAVFEKYDSPDTVFYCDPPYVGKEDYYPASKIDHDELVAALRDLEGRCLCSYADLPESATGLPVVTRDSHFSMGSGKQGHAVDTTERLLLNFDPEMEST
ncbi:DNA adenine methylase [Halorubellus sp. PRR65]|uniref:DNA adenine methylase n=1 Tax=Halorubellus sp. PRR65 TaxID=3098148 RepID=UPI002B2624D8|nr:DNA adenine methylase [Halorubellus sp. PRR65]